jgi:MFS family permease
VKSIYANRDAVVAANERLTPATRWALVSLSLSMLLSSLGTSITNVALPTLAAAFAASFQHVQWVVLAYLLATTTLIVSVGRLGDLTGRRRLLLAGIVLFTAASVLCGVAPSLWLLIAARGVQGFGAAIMMALTMAFVGETVPKAQTGSAMGLLGTMSAIGTALGPSLGGVLIAAGGWRAIFLIGKVRFAPLRVLVSEGKYREPDILLVRNARDPRRQNRYWLGADLVVEVVSEDDPERDTKVKRADYAVAGIPEYWIVNPLENTITVLVLEGETYTEHGIFHRGDRAVSKLLDGFSVSVAEVLDAE